MKNALRMALVALVAALALAAAGCQTKVVTDSAAQRVDTVTARGTGTVHASPDQAEMSFGLTARRTDAKEALSVASKAATTIADALKKAGIPAEDIQTQNVSVSPEYTGGDRGTPPRVTGYAASISVRAKVRDIGKLGDVIAAATDAGATEISGPVFTLSEDAMAASDAIEKAVEDARRRATAMAKAAGKQVGAVISMSEADVASPPIYYDLGYRAAAEAVPIEPGQLDVTARISVVFELK
ncbi:SIMPL domain-containing protein [Coriobacteriia bacterium Es71-Z0120]|uniref:SIMPL domain-containing protein n=1 Tax=Parvivirga hydrogeniphila TaxID=2939460 RepID=UPI002260A987|nr:SIMPL domain-containing protein [Parvivirga hydrogeniphila]MCL4078286.1 SIMPL domain-containing protein [Parvivirga hydrogeniphila]